MSRGRHNFGPERFVPPHAIRSDATTRRWDVKTGEVIHTLSGHRDHVKCVAVSPDGRTIASSSDDGTIKLWNIATGQLLLELPTERLTYLSHLEFSPDGKILACRVDHVTYGASVLVYYTSESHPRPSREEYTIESLPIAFSSDDH